MLGLLENLIVLKLKWLQFDVYYNLKLYINYNKII